MRHRLLSGLVLVLAAAIVVFLTSVAPGQLLIRVAHLLPRWADPRLVGGATQALVLLLIFALLRIRPSVLSWGRPSRAGITTGMWFVGATAALSFVVTVTLVAGSTDLEPGLSVASLLMQWKRDFPNSGLPGRAALLVILVPIFEEFLYRGLILGYLLRTRTAWLALALTTLLFAAGHNSWFLSGLIGLALGLLYLRFRNLWLCVLVHGAHNLFSSAGATLLTAGLHDAGMVSQIGQFLLPFQVGGLVIVIACLAMFWRKLFGKMSGEPSLPLRRPVGSIRTASPDHVLLS